MSVHLVDVPIDPSRWRLTRVPEDCGAAAEFGGHVRSEEGGRRIAALFYEIYPGMTLEELERVVDETRRAHPVREIRLVHRHGRIAVGELALWIQVLSPHRAEAFAAVEFCIRRLKEVVPIWKVEAEPA